ncbi:MAG TPA: type II toxin-antitoxin system Phd/YefM family antitoxin [Candidatus Baltobacteraceae bacterium]|jgi:prevent-host-death family protein|nr:type II toxin-antitoxin system Phd/YefM family antitoxin [Candidatus Baltobacteraceae bacterium]
MKQVGIFEAKTHLSALVDEAVAGETTIITRNGKPVAELRPIEANQRARARLALERIRALSEDLTGPPISARELIDEGRR